MKKFSVLLVAILALMMLFVSCENEPEKRAATKEDGEIIKGLFMYSGMPADGKTVIDVDENTKEFKMAECMDEEGKVVAVLNGTMTRELKTGTFSLNFGDGTKYKGKDHTLLAKVVMKMEKGEPVDVDSYEIVLDGVILTDFDFDYIFKTIFGKP